MDASYVQLLTEVLEMDRDSQRRLIDEVKEKLGQYKPNDADFEEAYDRGEMTATNAEESIAGVRKIID